MSTSCNISKVSTYALIQPDSISTRSLRPWQNDLKARGISPDKQLCESLRKIRQYQGALSAPSQLQVR